MFNDETAITILHFQETYSFTFIIQDETIPFLSAAKTIKVYHDYLHKSYVVNATDVNK